MEQTGTLILDDTMRIGYFTSDPVEYHHRLTLSILRIIQWLHDNVLDPHPQKGHFLRKRLSNGVEVSDKMNSYLISSFRHWKEQLSLNTDSPRQKRENKSINILIAVSYCEDPDCDKCQSFLQLLESGS